ncbi:unnamed protein product [Peniophora sp. CBMAI 1063]|nr:unnamed protein product [Peniophora sp. CBMAI 1063]
MKFTTTFAALAAVLAVDAASTIEKRQSSQCYAASKDLAAYERHFVYPLMVSCRDALGDSVEAKENPWVNKDCVAAAAVVGLPTFRDALTCTSSNSVTLTELSTWPSLDYNVYASIVGDCAWAEGGCPITLQNFIDLVYSAISDEDSPVYPDSAATVTENYIQPVFDWTAKSTAEGIPYTNFNDFLHYSGNLDHGCANGIGCSN